MVCTVTPWGSGGSRWLLGKVLPPFRLCLRKISNSFRYIVKMVPLYSVKSMNACVRYTRHHMHLHTYCALESNKRGVGEVYLSSKRGVGEVYFDLPRWGVVVAVSRF